MPDQYCLGSQDGPCPEHMRMITKRLGRTPLRCHSCDQIYRRHNQRLRYQRNKKVADATPKVRPAMAQQLRLNSLTPPDTSRWICSVCGCTERVACRGGCAWVGKQLCDQCATAEQLYIYSVAKKLGARAVILLFHGEFKLPAQYGLKVRGTADVLEKRLEREAIRRAQERNPKKKKRRKLILSGTD